MLLTKINWLIHLKTLFHEKKEVQDTLQIIIQLKKSLKDKVTEIQQGQDEVYSCEDVIEEILKQGLQQISYDNFFQIIGNLRQNSELQQSTCVDSFVDSIQEMSNSDKKKKQLDNISFKKTYQRQQSKSPVRISKLQNLQKAQQKILDKITNIEQEIENQKQQTQFKKNQNLFFKDVFQCGEELKIKSFRNLQPNEINQVLTSINLKQLKTLIIEDEIPDKTIQNIMCNFIGIQYLSLNNLGLSNILFIQNLRNLKVFSAQNNQIIILEGIPAQLEELYCSNNKITNLHIQNTNNLRIVSLQNNQLGQLQQLLALQNNKQLQFINLRDNPICLHTDYKKAIFKLFGNLKASDVDVQVHSQIQTNNEFFQKSEFTNFSFCQ